MAYCGTKATMVKMYDFYSRLQTILPRMKALCQIFSDDLYALSGMIKIIKWSDVYLSYGNITKKI